MHAHDAHCDEPAGTPESSGSTGSSRRRWCLSDRDRARRRVRRAHSRVDRLAQMSTPGLIASASEGLRARRLAEVDELRVIAAWADVHSDDGPGGLITPGGEGTPGVRDYSLGELALARRAGVVSTINAIADVLDLRHRMPLTWARTQTGVCDTWLVRKIARMTRHLPLARMWVVDQAIARMLGRQAPPRILAVAEGKIIEADPDLHNQRVEEEQRRRYVRLGAADTHGLRTLIARLESGDAAWVDATLTRVAEILHTRHDDLDPQELRAKALGYLARPAELLTLLATHTTNHTPDGHAHPDTEHPDTEHPGADGGTDHANRDTSAATDHAGGRPSASGLATTSSGHGSRDGATSTHRDQGPADSGPATTNDADSVAEADRGTAGQDVTATGRDTVATDRDTATDREAEVSGHTATGRGDATDRDANDRGAATGQASGLGKGHPDNDHTAAAVDEQPPRHDYDTYDPRDGWADHLTHHTDPPPAQPDSATDPGSGTGGLHRAIAYPTELLAALTHINWATLRPRHHLYLHLHEDVLTHDVPGAVRIEGLPAMTLDQIHGLLTGAHVTVKPVIDLNQHQHTNAYEHPDTIKERVHLIHGGDYWPHAPSTSRHLDYDHITPYRPDGPPGQTGTHNSAPIARRHHRYRTHAGYRVHPLPDINNKPGTHLWTTPHGQTFLTNHHGTHAIPTDAAHALTNAPPTPPLHHHTGPPALAPDDE